MITDTELNALFSLDIESLNLLYKYCLNDYIMNGAYFVNINKHVWRKEFQEAADYLVEILCTKFVKELCAEMFRSNGTTEN